ncbi:efflux RND transporter permease subunit [Pseudomonas aeruginosa]|nr:efflux RND transporter permease subunit [Pseudomonas aeruginosa]
MVDAVLSGSFGQRQVSTIFNPLNQYRVVMEVDQQYQQSQRSSARSGDRQRRPARAPLSAFSHYEPSRAPPEVNHQGRFAATTLSFQPDTGRADRPDPRGHRCRPPEPLRPGGRADQLRGSNAGAVQDTQNQMLADPPGAAGGVHRPPASSTKATCTRWPSSLGHRLRPGVGALLALILSACSRAEPDRADRHPPADRHRPRRTRS